MAISVVVVTAHMDDESLGCGGYIHSMRESGVVVYPMVITSTPVHMFEEACSILGCSYDMSQMVYPDQACCDAHIAAMASAISDILATNSPSIVVTHDHSDINADHRMVFQATRIACRSWKRSGVSRLMTFPIPGNGWSGSAFQPNVYAHLSIDDVRSKAQAVDCYASLFGPRASHIVYKQSEVDGADISAPFAEKFRLEIEVLPRP
jgi:LmbE family N-acetylglucosaminyl deacetylase